MHQAGFVARPARSTITETHLHIGEIRAGIRPSVLAGPPPKRQPLTGMTDTHALHGAHDGKDDHPYRHVRQMALAWSERSAERRRIEAPEYSRARGAIDGLDRDVQERHLKKLVVKGRHPCAAQQLVQPD